MRGRQGRRCAPPTCGKGEDDDDVDDDDHDGDGDGDDDDGDVDDDDDGGDMDFMHWALSPPPIPRTSRKSALPPAGTNRGR